MSLLYQCPIGFSCKFIWNYLSVSDAYLSFVLCAKRFRIVRGEIYLCRILQGDKTNLVDRSVGRCTCSSFNGFILTVLRFAGRSMSPLENRRSFGTCIHILLLLPIHHKRKREREATRDDNERKKKRESSWRNIWNGSE